MSGSDTPVAVNSHIPFNLGALVITPAAIDLLTGMGLSPYAYLNRHHRRDWGNLSEEDRVANDQALASGEDRIFSSYHLEPEARDPEKYKLWIITEWDRSVTTILLPSDY